MKLSLIIPVYNEQENVSLLHKKLIVVLKQLDLDFEIIYINDGSTDKSEERLDEISKDDGNVRLISLSRNYGQTQAIAAGVDNSKGEVIVTMDADMQNDPRDIPQLLEKLKEGYDVVSGWRRRRKDNLLFKIIPSSIANILSAAITNVQIHDLGCTLKAYRREVLKNIEFHGEIHRLLPLYAAMQGAKIAEISVKHHKRKYGKSKYSLLRFFKVILDMFTIMFMWKFLTKPIYAFGGIGIVFLIISAIMGLFIVLRKVFLAGLWVSPLLFIFLITFTTGIQFILMGILAEFIIRLYYGMKEEKRYKIKERE